MSKSMRFYATLILVSGLLSACTKIETTTLGVDLIPTVDNISTFDTVMQVVANNYIPTDTTRLRLSDDHAVGGLYNDERFGDTKATIFFEFKPNFPVTRVDSIVGLDSVVLVLKHVSTYGARDIPMKLNLFGLSSELKPDTLTQPSYMLSDHFAIDRSRILGTKTFIPTQLADTVDIKRGDSVYRRVVNQLRIPIPKAYFEGLWRDTAVALKSDSAFEEVFDGFALEIENQANALLYFRLNNEESGLEFYYRSKIVGTDRIDTTSQKWSTSFNTGHANHIERLRTGSEVENFLVRNPTEGHPQVYIQSAPGVMAELEIPGLATLGNRLIHRAELRMVQMGATGFTPETYTPPLGIYLDRKEQNSDTSYAGIPFDLSPLQGYFCFPFNGIDFNYYGGVAAKETVGGEQVTVYRINLSRYIQNVIAKGDPIFKLRLSAPFYMVYRNCNFGFPGFASNVFPYQSSGGFIDPPGFGQVRLGGGNHPDPNLRMQLRIVYSRL